MRPLILVCLLVLPAHAELSFVQEEGKLSVEEDGKILFIYRTDQRVPCLYPLYGPGGTNLTRHFPLREGVAGEQKDHPHHVSFWMAHGSVNGIDFWQGKEARITHEGFGGKIPVPADGKMSFTVDLAWRPTAGSAPLLTEKRTYAFSRMPETYLLDVTSVLTAGNKDVVFGDTKEGTCAIRLTPTLRLKGEVAQGHLVNSEGIKDGDVWGKRANWVADYGPDAAGNPAVVALMDHPNNLRHPTWWHARDYGLLAANPFGRHDFEGLRKEPHAGDYTLKAGETLTQRYRLVLQAGQLESIDLNKVYEEFSR